MKILMCAPPFSTWTLFSITETPLPFLTNKFLLSRMFSSEKGVNCILLRTQEFHWVPNNKIQSWEVSMHWPTHSCPMCDDIPAIHSLKGDTNAHYILKILFLYYFILFLPWEWGTHLFQCPCFSLDGLSGKGLCGGEGARQMVSTLRAGSSTRPPHSGSSIPEDFLQPAWHLTHSPVSTWHAPTGGHPPMCPPRLADLLFTILIAGGLPVRIMFMMCLLINILVY